MKPHTPTSHSAALQIKLPDGDFVDTIRQTKKYLWIKPYDSDQQRRLPIANLLRDGKYQFKTNDRATFYVNDWPRCITHCLECNAMLATTESGRVCPSGHGRIYPRVRPLLSDSDREHLEHEVRMLTQQLAIGVSGMAKAFIIVAVVVIARHPDNKKLSEILDVQREITRETESHMTELVETVTELLGIRA